MRMGCLLLLLLGAGLFLWPGGSVQTAVRSGTSSYALPVQALPAVPPPAFTVCHGTFALCTEAICDPVIKTVAGKKKIEFSCACKAQVGYSAGLNLDRRGNPCEKVPTAPPAVGQEIPSRYSPIKSYVACRNNRPWAQCLDARCVVDHVDKNDPSQGAATCSCQVATGSPYGYIPRDGKYSEKGCKEEYISSATVDDALQITEFLTTPAGKNLAPTLPVLLVPTPTPTPQP